MIWQEYDSMSSCNRKTMNWMRESILTTDGSKIVDKDIAN